MFSKSYNPTKLKVNLKLAINRTQMMQKKKENQGLVAKKDVANLLGRDKPELARIRTEQIIRDDYMIETLEIMEVYFNMLVSRLGLIDAVKVCDPGIREAVCTIIWAAPYLQAEISEMKLISQALTLRYGKEFAQDALENRDKGDGSGTGWVSERIIKKLRVTTPSSAIVTGYLQAIAKTYGIVYNFLEPLPQDMHNGGFTADMFPDPPSNNAMGGSGGNNNDNTNYNNNNNNNNGGGGNMPNIDHLFPPPVQQKPLPTYPPDQKKQDLYPPEKPTQQPQQSFITPSAPPTHDPNLFPPPPQSQHNQPSYPPSSSSSQGHTDTSRPLPIYPEDNKSQYMDQQPNSASHDYARHDNTNSINSNNSNTSTSYDNAEGMYMDPQENTNMYEEIQPRDNNTTTATTNSNNNNNNNSNAMGAGRENPFNPSPTARQDSGPPSYLNSNGNYDSNPNVSIDFPMPPQHNSQPQSPTGLGSVGGGSVGGVGQESEVPDFDELLRRFHDLKTEGEQ